MRSYLRYSMCSARPNGGTIRDSDCRSSADKAFYSWINTFECYTLNVDPLVLRQGSKPHTVGHNTLIRDAGYSQRWMAETSYSTVKRSLGSAVRAQFWYHEFRETVLEFAVSNIKQLCELL